MDDFDENNIEPGSNPSEPLPRTGELPDFLTISQAYEYLLRQGLPRSKKTLRKWCRLGHVEIKENVIPGGPKWLVIRHSLDAKIEEEKLIEASLTQETGSNPSEPVLLHTSSNPSEPVRPDEIVELLKEQLKQRDDQLKQKDDQLKRAHERERAMSSTIDSQLSKYHELAQSMAEVGLTIGKAMQPRQLPKGEPGSNQFAQGREHIVNASYDDTRGEQSHQSMPDAAPTWREDHEPSTYNTDVDTPSRDQEEVDNSFGGRPPFSI